MSRRLSASVGLFKGDRLLKSGDFKLVQKVEVNLYLLPALAVGLVRGKDDDLIHNRLRQLRHVHIFFRQRDKAVEVGIHFLLLLHPFFRNFNFEL